MMKQAFLASALTAMLCSVATADFAVNGGFETGDTSGWVSFPTSDSTFDVTNDANSGSFAGEINNSATASSAVVKQANVGQGVVVSGEEILISFAAKGQGAIGGVAFAEFFSEIDGGGVSSSEILGGAPLALTNDWQQFNFSATTGPDVSGGITLQFGATTGADTGSTMQLFIDDVTITRAVPEPTALGVLGLAGLGLVFRRRR